MSTPVRRLLAFPALLWLTLFSVPSIWLLFNASTLRGTLIALTGLVTALWPILVLISSSRGALARLIQIGGAALITVGLALIILTAPSGNPGRGSPVSNRYAGSARYHRLAISNLVPEIEQLEAGFTLAPFVDPLIDQREARRIRALTRDVYSGIEADPDFRALGSALGYGYTNVLGASPDSGHYFLYIPRNHINGSLPALVFLHGSAGNFKAYTWILSRVAEERGMIVIAPTFGFGNWRQRGGLETITRALDHASTITSIDPDHVYLAGLSNGGLGVSLAAADQPDRFAGLIFLSPVFATEATDTPDFAAAWQNHPVLILTGAADDRIPVSYVETRASILDQGGVDVTLKIYPDENHFLIFDRRDEVVDDIIAWLDAN
jgi:pimeloyl-ACP methyl ester carboxylesterase